MDLSAELERVAELHNQGMLSDDEFAAAKACLLAQGHAGDPQPAASPTRPPVLYPVHPPGFVPPPSSGADTNAKVLLGIGIAIAAVLLVAILAIVAVTFLGRSASSKFSSVGYAVDG